MYCPLKFTVFADPEVSPTEKVLDVNCQCELTKCAWYDEYFGKCSMAVDSYLKGIADHRLEVKQSTRDGY